MTRPKSRFISRQAANRQVIEARNNLMRDQLKKLGEIALQLNLEEAIAQQKDLPADVPLFIKLAGGYGRPCAIGDNDLFTQPVHFIAPAGLSDDISVDAVQPDLYRRMADALLRHVLTPITAAAAEHKLWLVPVTLNLPMESQPATHAVALGPDYLPLPASRMDMKAPVPHLVSIHDKPLFTYGWPPLLLTNNTQHMVDVQLPPRFNDMVSKAYRGSQGVTTSYTTRHGGVDHTATFTLDTHLPTRHILQPTPADVPHSPLGRMPGNRPGSRLKKAQLG